MYGILSHSVHGNWQDLIYYNLIPKGNGYKLNFKWKEPRSQAIVPWL